MQLRAWKGINFHLLGRRWWHCHLGPCGGRRKIYCASRTCIWENPNEWRGAGAQCCPPYETTDTILRLEADLRATGATTVVCLGDSFDDLEAERGLPENEKLWLTRLQAGRRWIWIEGNHDPGLVEIAGSHLAELPLPPVVFRHEAKTGISGEISGHYHPKARLNLRGSSYVRPAFLIDIDRVIMPAYGTYTGGLHAHTAPLRDLMRPDAIAVLTGSKALAIPMPRDK